MKQKIGSLALSAALVAAQFGVISTPSFAAAKSQSGCSCQSTASNAAQVGTITSVSGDVMVSGDSGYQAAKVGSPISRDGQLITGIDGKLTGVMGGCSFNMPANATMSVVNNGSKVCLKMAGVKVTPTADMDPPMNEGNLLPLAAGVLLIGGGIGIAFALSNDKKSP